MITKKEYLVSLYTAFKEGKYLLKALPLSVMAAFGIWGTFQGWQYYGPLSFLVGIIWLFIILVMIPVELLNRELEKRDAENQLCNPKAYAERTYVGICRLIKEAEKHLLDQAPFERWEKWGKEVQRWLTTRLGQTIADIYVLNSRPPEEVDLKEPERALGQLKQCLGRLDYILSR